MTKPVLEPSVQETWIILPAPSSDIFGPHRQAADAAETLPAVLYPHSGGWILSNTGYFLGDYMGQTAVRDTAPATAHPTGREVHAARRGH